MAVKYFHDKTSLNEELFTWTLSIKPNEKKTQIVKLTLYGRSISVHSINKEATHLTIPL